MTRIPVKTAYTVAEMRDKSKVTLPGADRLTVDGSGYGSGKSLTLETLEWACDYKFLAATGHGLTDADVGKALTSRLTSPTVTILDDTNSLHWPIGILMKVPTVDQLLVAMPGAHVRLPIALLEFGDSWSYTTHGRVTWWDLSELKHRPARQSTAYRGMASTLYVLSVGPTTFDAIVRPMVPALRMIPEKTLSASDITNKYTSLLPANAAADVQVTVGGVPVSTEDGTFTSSTGNLSWTGLGLESTAVEGLRVMGFWEPKQ